MCCFAPTELGSWSGTSWIYKDLVPLGPKTTAIKNNECFLNETEIHGTKHVHSMNKRKVL
jgi:hypothetical protein